jgi:Fe-S cluster biogenesis protein NfuA
VRDGLARTEGEADSRSRAFEPDRLYAGTLQERVQRVVDTIIAPVLKNDGGRMDILEIRDDGSLEVRFVGSCANCPYSLLSMEQIVKPTLLQIPGITRVVHRARLRDTEVSTLRALEKRSLTVLTPPGTDGGIASCAPKQAPPFGQRQPKDG